MDNFQNQPRHIKLLVCIAFPFYAIYRVETRAVWELLQVGWRLGIKIADACEKIYTVCRNVYNIMAPKIWNRFIKPYILLPIKLYIIIPIVRLSQYLFDTVSQILSVVFDSVVQTFKLFFP